MKQASRESCIHLLFLQSRFEDKLPFFSFICELGEDEVKDRRQAFLLVMKDGEDCQAAIDGE